MFWEVNGSRLSTCIDMFLFIYNHSKLLTCVEMFLLINGHSRLLTGIDMCLIQGHGRLLTIINMFLVLDDHSRLITESHVVHHGHSRLLTGINNSFLTYMVIVEGVSTKSLLDSKDVISSVALPLTGEAECHLSCILEHHLADTLQNGLTPLSRITEVFTQTQVIITTVFLIDT